MSSTSFSSYEQRGKDVLKDSKYHIFDSPSTGQFYNKMAQPLIYYTEQPDEKKFMRRQKQRKNNQNYFLKAFKWYSQERPLETQRKRSAELYDFATWLDTKYSEYLRESENTVTSGIMETHRESGRTKTPCKAKRFGRIRSPWNRCKSRNKAEEPCKMNLSCEFILQPKDLTAPASEFCNPISLYEETNEPSKARNVNHECQCYKERSTINEPAQYNSNKNCLCKCPVVELSSNIKQTNSSLECRCMASPKPPKNSNKNNVSCQCSEEIIKLDDCTQYDQNDFADTIRVCTKAEKSKCDLPSAEYSCDVRDVLTVEKVTHGVSIFSNDCVQTSDHSITIANEDGHEHIYFMKIICSEKRNSNR